MFNIEDELITSGGNVKTKMTTAGGLSDPSVSGGTTLKPYLKRKKSSFGDTKIAVLGLDGVGKSGKFVKIRGCRRIPNIAYRLI